jgi:hypothetical protein
MGKSEKRVLMNIDQQRHVYRSLNELEKNRSASVQFYDNLRKPSRHFPLKFNAKFYSLLIIHPTSPAQSASHGFWTHDLWSTSAALRNALGRPRRLLALRVRRGCVGFKVGISRIYAEWVLLAPKCMESGVVAN